MFSEIMSSLMQFITAVIYFIIDIFPDSPFLEFNRTIPEGLRLDWIAWIIPIQDIIIHFTLFLSAMLVFYAVRIAGRWVKVVKS